LFTTLPSGETQLSSLPSQVVPRGILAGEEKARRTAADRMGFIQQEIRELQELADASSMSTPTVPHTNSSNMELLDEIRRLKEQMHAVEQRIQTQPSAEQATTEEPPEYTKT
jgi:FtsZ-binding cell division protein ZapB